jgi:hypothetical protein
VSLKLLAEQLLIGCKGSLSRGLYISGELSRQRLAFSSRVVLYASPNNQGAEATAQALQAGMDGLIEVTSDRGSATHMLLYLNWHTYAGDAGSMLADELRSVRSEARGAVPIVMAHENDEGRGGCDFGHFFSTVTHKRCIYVLCCAAAAAANTRMRAAPAVILALLRSHV